METRANYVLIGLFSLLGFLGILGFVLWFANVELDRQFAYYDVDFPSIAGLSDASDVRFAGLPVGQVVDVRLAPGDAGLVRVRIEVTSDTPVRTDSVATIESLGVTGVSFVGLSAGTPQAPLLRDDAEAEIPMIEAGQSVLQSLSQDAPAILEETLGILSDLRGLISAGNQRRVETILEDIESASGAFAQALEDFSAVSGTVTSFATEIERFNATLNSLTADASGVLRAAEEALASIEVLSEDTRALLAAGSGTLDRAQVTIDGIDQYVTGSLGPATRQLERSAAEAEASIAALANDTGALIATYAETGRAATARLQEAEQTLVATEALIARIDTTLASVEGAAQSFDAMIVDEAGPLLADLRAATAEATDVLETIGAAAETDLPAILSDIRAAAQTAAEVASTVGSDLSSATGDVDALLAATRDAIETAGTTFANANDTLTAINAALATGDRALGAAERAFTGAERVVNDDLDAIVGRLNATLDEVELAVGAVAADIPAVTEELRAASQSAEAAFAGIEATIDQSSPALRAFATEALPQYGRLAIETRALVENLDTLFEQIRRDPGRFFLDSGAPEFRR